MYIHVYICILIYRAKPKGKYLPCLDCTNKDDRSLNTCFNDIVKNKW